MNPKFAILIATIPERRELLARVCNELERQIKALKAEDDVIIVINPDEEGKEKETTGTKRNALLRWADIKNVYGVAFMDDDDLPSENYVRWALEFVKSGMDCAELWGQIYFAGIKGKPFHHSIEHKEWYEDDKYYYRMPNHLNFMKLELIKNIPFPDKTFGEDGQASYAWRDAGVFKTMFPITQIIYHYFVGEPKHAI